MRAILIATLAAGGICLLATSSALAAPANGAAIAGAAGATSMVQDVRLYHQTSNSKYWRSSGNLGRHACLGGHIRHSSRRRVYAGRC